MPHNYYHSHIKWQKATLLKDNTIFIGWEEKFQCASKNHKVPCTSKYSGAKYAVFHITEEASLQLRTNSLFDKIPHMGSSEGDVFDVTNAALIPGKEMRISENSTILHLSKIVSITKPTDKMVCFFWQIQISNKAKKLSDYSWNYSLYYNCINNILEEEVLSLTKLDEVTSHNVYETPTLIKVDDHTIDYLLHKRTSSNSTEIEIRRFTYGTCPN